MPRAGLTSSVVAAEASDVADEVGLHNLTLAAVAKRLGVMVPSLYKHVDGLDGLRRDVAVAATEALARELAAAAVGRARGDALRSMAQAYRSFAARHPGRYAATVRAAPPDDDEHRAASDSALSTVMAILAGYGIRDGDAIDAIRMVRSALHGFVTLEGAGGFGLPHDVDRSFDRMVTALDSALEGWPT